MKKLGIFLSVTCLFLLTISQTVVFGQFKTEVNKKIDTSKQKTLAPSFAFLGNTAQAQNTNTLNFTVPAGNNCLLLVAASDDNALDIDNVTFGGNAMTEEVELTDGTFAVDAFYYRVLGNCSSTTANIVVTSTGSTPNSVANIAAYALYGVDQGNPISNSQSAQDNTGSSTLNVTSGTGDLVIDLFDTFELTATGGNEPRTIGPGQTSIFSFEDIVVQDGFASYDSSSEPGAATVTMSWTSDNDAYIHLAVNINGIGPTAADVSISGRIVTAKGIGLPYTLIELTRPDGSTEYVRSNPFGFYKFNDIEAGETYTISVKHRNQTFEQPTQVITVSENITDLNFIAN